MRAGVSPWTASTTPGRGIWATRTLPASGSRFQEKAS
jgi:hypothetical protein